MIEFIANLRLGRKLALLGGIALLLCLALLFLRMQDSLSKLSFIDKELSGLEPSRDLLEFVRLTQQHRGLSASVLGGRAESEPDRNAMKLQVDAAGKRFEEVIESAIHNARIREDWRRNIKEWSDLSAAVNRSELKGPESFARHSALIASLIELHDRVSDHFGLTLDPEADGYFLVIASLQQMPRLTELMGQTRAIGTQMLAAQSYTPETRAALAGLSTRISARLRELQVTLEKAFEANPEAKRAVGGVVEQASSRTNEVLGLARREILETTSASYSPAEYFRTTTSAIDAVYGLADSAKQTLRVSLNARRSSLVKHEAALFSAVVAALAIGLWISLVTAKSITRPAAVARDAARRIANGDLTGDVPVGGQDEMGELLTSMRQMQVSLTNVVSEVRANAESVATASSQIAQGNQDLSQRTEEQASSLQQTAATMEQLGATVKLNAENAKQANQLAQSASSVAAEGGEVVGQVIETMKSIADSSQRVADIIGTIEGIALQTNILALNAAVEAARAGSQGLGFAVVAREVRNLSQRSSEAAKEIKSLIAASAERVELGSQQVDHAGRSMTEVVRSIRRVSDTVAEISAASAEQSLGVGQVGEAVSHMDQVTQQNAALVEESAAAAESLRAQASTLVEAVSTFKLPAVV